MLSKLDHHSLRVTALARISFRKEKSAQESLSRIKNKFWRRSSKGSLDLLLSCLGKQASC
jgi:hypothetical protein